MCIEHVINSLCGAMKFFRQIVVLTKHRNGKEYLFKLTLKISNKNSSLTLDLPKDPKSSFTYQI